MSTSKTEITVNELELSVYGLKEYKKLDDNTPVAIMFAMHGRTKTKRDMSTISQVLCSLNGSKGGIQRDRHLLVVAFDHLNHGTRLVNKTRNQSWSHDKTNNPTHAMDQWEMILSAANTVKSLMDVLEDHLFGPSQKPVQVWGCVGFSMGAHASFITAANDPRISVQISFVGASDFIGLLENRLKEGQFPSDYLPTHFIEKVKSYYTGLDEKLVSKKVLMINGGSDTLVPPRFNDDLVQYFRTVEPPSNENKTWARIILPGVGHAWSPPMFDLASRWCLQWMISSSSSSSSSSPPTATQSQFYLTH